MEAIALLAVLINLVGILVGFLLSEGASVLREARTEKKQKRSVRSIIRFEIDHNLDLLRNLWGTVNQVDKSNEEFRKKNLTLKFIEMPAPLWKTHALTSQLSHFALAFNEEEVKKVLKFYDALSKIDSLRMGLRESAVGQRESHGNISNVIYSNALEFVQKVPSYWDEIEGLVLGLVNAGNPLQDDKA